MINIHDPLVSEVEVLSKYDIKIIDNPFFKNKKKYIIVLLNVKHKVLEDYSDKDYKHTLNMDLLILKNSKYILLM